MPLRLATHCMGTRFELVLQGEDPRFLRAAGEVALGEIEECHARFSLFRRDSLLARINREASTRWVRVDAEAFALLELCDAISAQSEGAFDPTVGPLMREFGFHPREDSVAGGVVGWRHVELDRRSRAIRFHHPGVSLDLGAVAKGFGLDQAAGSLREEGVTCAFLQGGTSTMLAIGAPPRAPAGWRVALGEPDSDPPAPVADLRDCALSVSAPHGRTLRRDGETLTHVMDPRLGRPVRNDVERAAVLAASAAVADAWSTALLVRGRQGEPPGELHTLVATRPIDSQLIDSQLIDWTGDRLTWHLDDSPPPHPTGSRFRIPTEQQQPA